MDAIAVQALSVRRGDFVLGPMDFSIAQGEIFALLGKTGAGKTVLLETLAGFYDKAYHGTIRLFGENTKALPLAQRPVGFVYQDCGLFPHMTLRENIGYGLKMHGANAPDIQSKVNSLSELLSISHILEQYPAMASGGEKQRAALARALALSPKILLLDEPFTALDPATKATLYAEIRHIHQTFGCTILFVTHDFQEARQLAQRIGILLGGKLRALVKAEALFQTEYVAEVAAFLKGYAP
ncbi:MAG: ATP-binding cassette domain-containing protein [Candidatus Pelethousia sp.]|nr:ATP-binding cassette domain-containing protein [Candidatus Pelethousia sp.]